MRKGYNVYCNDKFIQFIDGRSQAGIKEYIKHRAVIGTHMGEWRRVLTIRPEDTSKTCFEWEYSTTVGKYFRFCPAFLD